VGAALVLGRKPIGKAQKLVLRPTILKVRPSRKGKALLRRGGRSVKVNISGGGRFVTRKVKIVR
jgi:hypothetical protein